MNEKNLIPNSERSPSEVRENGKKGGINSGASRRKKRDMKACFQELFQSEIPDGLKKPLEKAGMENADTANFCEALTYSMMNKAVKGDTRAISLIMDIMGEKQSDKIKSEELKLKRRELKLKEKAVAKAEEIKDIVEDDALSASLKALAESLENEQ